MKEKFLSEIDTAVREAKACIVPSNDDNVYISVNEYTSYGDFIISEDEDGGIFINFINNVSPSSIFNTTYINTNDIHDDVISIIERLKYWLDKYIMIINKVSDELQDDDISYTNDFKSGTYFFKNNSTGKIICCEPIVNIDNNIDNEIIKVSIIGSDKGVTVYYDPPIEQQNGSDNNLVSSIFTVIEIIKFFLL